MDFEEEILKLQQQYIYLENRVSHIDKNLSGISSQVDQFGKYKTRTEEELKLMNSQINLLIQSCEFLVKETINKEDIQLAKAMLKRLKTTEQELKKPEGRPNYAFKYRSTELYCPKAERKALQSEYELSFILDEAVQELKEIDPIKRKKWIKHQIDELFYKQNKKCAICGNKLILDQCHVDHKIPHSKGGGNEFTNLQLTHPFCNQSKNNGVRLSDLLKYLEGRVMNL